MVIYTFLVIVVQKITTVYAYKDPRTCYKNRYRWLNLAVNTFITLSTLLTSEPFSHTGSVRIPADQIYVYKDKIDFEGFGLFAYITTVIP